MKYTKIKPDEGEHWDVDQYTIYNSESNPARILNSY
jgi:hypothetical protein